MSYNVHPFQLFSYEANNQELQKLNEDAELRKAGQAPLEDQLKSFFDQAIAKENASLATGETISYDRWTEILGDVIRKYKAETAAPGGARDHNGNFKDFLEVRRPFVEPSHEGHAQ
jgi:hypothetical protein